jgi:hypothetical protein
MMAVNGRPKKYQNVAELQKLIDLYFESCFTDKSIKDKDGNNIGVERVQIRPFTITGLCLALDTSREGLLNYQNDKSNEKFFDTVTRAKLKCHNYAEELAMTSRNPTGVIFNLRNNYGWKDKTEQEVSINDMTINVTVTEE